MRVRQIGTFVFDANTNIVVDANNQDVPGIGFRVNDFYDPQPFSVEIAFQRATREQALNAVNTLARELHNYAQRRQDARLAIAGGALVVVEDAAGNATLRSYLRDGSVTLLGVETTSTGVIVRARVAGTLVNPFLNYNQTVTSVLELRPYERRVVALNVPDEYLYKSPLQWTPSNMTGLYNVLLAVEDLGSATGTSRIQAISPASVSGGITIQSWNAGWQTLARGNFTSATSGTITYTIPPSVPPDVYRLFIEIHCPSTPPSNARYVVSWPEQPQVAETISGDRSWYTPTLITPYVLSFPLTLEIQNVPVGTLVMPLVLIPIDGVFVWNAIAPPTLHYVYIIDPQITQTRTFDISPNGTVYGSPGLISSRYVAVFSGAMASMITNASADMYFYSRRIEPAAFA